MWNLARFNLQRFNLPADSGEDVALSAMGIEQYDALISNGENIYAVSAGTERVQMRAFACPGTLTTADFSEKVLAKASGGMAFALNQLGSESIEARVFAGGDLFVAEQVETTLMGKAICRLNLMLLEHATASLLGRAAVGEDCYLTEGAYVLILAQVSPYLFTLLTLDAKVNIPPGGKLIIDTENYEMTLNGENVIHLHSGDWPQLARVTHDMLVTAGTRAKLPISLLFTERYL